MITVIFRVRMKPGKEDGAIAAFRKMVESVQAQEPDTLLYAFHRRQDDPSEIVFWESYADDAAFQTHMGTPHMGEMRAAFGELFDTSTVKLERLDRVAGFARDGFGRPETGGTVSLIFRVPMQAGKEETVLEQLRQTAEAVEAQEPGALCYRFHRPQEAPSELVLLEAWDDDAALQAHMQTPHMKEFWASYPQLFDAPQAKVDRLERVAGFSRAG